MPAGLVERHALQAARLESVTERIAHGAPVQEAPTRAAPLSRVAQGRDHQFLALVLLLPGREHRVEGRNDGHVPVLAALWDAYAAVTDLALDVNLI